MPLLDNCEHVIDAAAGLAAAILGGAPGVSIRRPAGSRRADGRVPVPPGPPTSRALRQTDRRGGGDFPAVQLFVERVSAIVEDFALTDANALRSPRFAAGSMVCRGHRAAAPRVEVLGVKVLPPA